MSTDQTQTTVRKSDDYDPRALRAFAMISSRQGDTDTARIFRAAATEIERLRARVQELEAKH